MDAPNLGVTDICVGWGIYHGNGRTKIGCDRYVRWMGHISKNFFYKCNKIKISAI
jgi:hypothetical protein